MKFHGSLLGSLAVLSLALAACGSDPSIVEVPGDPHAQILSFAVTPNAVDAGGEVTAQWKTQDANGIELTRNGTAVDLGGASVADGSVKLTVQESSVFVLKATGKTDVVASESASVAVKTAPRPAIVAFTATPATVQAGETTTLEWQTKDTDTVRIVDGSGTALELGDAVAAEGSVTTAALGASTSFKLIAERAGQPASERTVTVTVQRIDMARIVSFTAEPAEVEEGGMSRLSWVTENAETVQLFAGAEAIDLQGQGAAFGSVDIHPTASGTYRLVASKAEQTDEKTVQVRVKGFPTASFEIAPSPIDFGGAATVTWSTEEAESVTIADSFGNPMEGGAVDASGTRSIHPAMTTTFTLTATGPTGKVARVTDTVEVRPAVLAFALTNTEPAGVGDVVGLTWETGGATSVELSNLDGATKSIQGVQVAEGAATMPVGAGGRFEIVARSGRLETRAEVQVDLMLEPAIGSFGANRDVVSLVGGSADVRLSWSGVNRADTLELDDSNLGRITLTPADVSAGFKDVTISADTVFTFTARNSAGFVSVQEDVRVVSMPAIAAVSVFPDYIGAGESVDLTWTSTGATNVVILANGMVVPGTHPASGTASIPVNVSTTFEVKAYNDALDSVSGLASVSVGAPQILSFTASRVNAWTGTPITFDWTSRGAGSLTISRSGTVVHSTSMRTEAMAGSFTTPPLANGVYDYELEVKNAGGGSKKQTIHVRVGAGPSIDNFAVNPAQLLSGTDATFTWSAGPDPDGNVPTLALTANLGGPYAMPATPAGTKAFTLTDLGAYTFTLTATTTATGSVAATQQATTTVFGTPAVTLASTPALFDDEFHSDVELIWTSQNADTSLELFEIVSGTPTSIVLVPAASRASGSYHAGPQTAARTFRIVATNGLGMTAQKDVTVAMQGPQIVSFTGAPVEIYPSPEVPPAVAILAGDDVSLQWTTRKSTKVSLDFLTGMTLAPSTEPFIDASTAGTKLNLTTACITTWVPGDEGCANLTFPNGFTFPFGGINQTAIRIFANGVASFDLTRTGSSYGNGSIVPTSNAWAHLSVFWDDLFFPTDMANANIYYLEGTTTGGERYLVVQWKDASFVETVGPPAESLNFEIVLFESGDFEYRYAGMDSASAPGRATGNDATLGYVAPGGAHHNQVSLNTAVPGGLANTAWRFSNPPSLSLTGSYTWKPLGGTGIVNRTATLKATAPGMPDATATVNVAVHPKASATLAVNLPSGQTNPIRNTPFTLAWTAQNATAVRVEDSSGTVRCTAAPDRITSGSCSVTETTTGSHTYTVVATGALGHEVTTTATTTVISANYAIVAFDVSATTLDFGQPVTLTWETGDADVLTITANGQPLALPPTVDITSDSFTIPSMSETTTFVLTIDNLSLQTPKTATKTVTVRTVSLPPLTVSPSDDVAPGTPVTIGWNPVSLTGSSPYIMASNWPMAEDTTATRPFIDISTAPDVQTHVLKNSTGGVDDDDGFVIVPFPSGFSFKFEGKTHTQAILNANGWVSFAPALTTTSTWTNQRLPATGNKDVHLAPYWDDLHRRAGGALQTAMVGADFVISWNHFSHVTGSTDANPYDLNFQIVLHPDGSFDYRYGNMAAPATSPNNSSCYPSTCVNEANASSATVGYSMSDGTVGSTFHFGGSTNGSSNVPFPAPGIANRTFVFNPPQTTDQLVVTPGTTTDYKVCAFIGTYSECKTVTVKAEFKLVSFGAASSTTNFGQPIDLTWVVKNANSLTLKQGSTVLATEADVDLANGTFSVTPADTTTYTLEVKNTYLNQTLTATKTITVKQFALGLTATSPSTAPGDAVTLTWNATTFDPSATTVLVTPLEDVSATSAYSDISGVAGTPVFANGKDSSTALATVTFAGGFTFPYMGTPYAAVKVSPAGYLSFAASPSATGTNAALPTTSSGTIHIAPFWDSLHTRDNGKVYAAQVGADYVIQWTNMSMTTGSKAAAGGNPAVEHNLNFQVVLHPDGSFEYRYGLMEGLAPGVTDSACFPNTCANEANGSAATIGYQIPGGAAGYQLHFGGASPAAANFPFGGGLSHKAFRFGAYSGSGTMVVNPYDTTLYRICAVAGTFLECTEPVTVRKEWGIVSFTAPTGVPMGGNVPLSWVTSGGGTVTLKSTVGTTNTMLPVQGLPAEAYTDVLAGKTTYTLEVNSFGRKKTMSKVVDVQTVQMDLTASATSVLPGAPVTLTWNATSIGGGTPVVDSNFVGGMVEVTSVPFDNIVGNGGTQVINAGITSGGGVAPSTSYQKLTFDPSFTFPYFGTNKTSVIIGMQGFLSFDATISGDNYSNKTFPVTTATSTEQAKIALAPWWGDVQTRATSNAPAGGVYWKFVPTPASGVPYYVIQYDHMTAWQNTTVDATFQVLLFADGAFEYRYGTMLPLTETSAGYMARGAAKTIGWQNPGTTMAQTLHYNAWGSTGSASGVFPGGLAGRTFRYDGPAPLSGTKTVNPTKTTTYRICAVEAGYQECKTVTIKVPAAGEVTITEMMIQPAGGAADQWFEVRNLGSTAIDLDGWEIVGATGNHVITGPLLVPAHGFATLAASPNPGFTPSYVYGTGVSLGTGSAGELRLKAGSLVISEAVWNATWSVPAGKSLSLDGAFHQNGVAANSTASQWCQAAAPTPGALGVGCAFTTYDVDRYASVPFQDIRWTGTMVPALAADSGRAGITLPFNMPIFDQSLSQVWVDSNGWLSFAATQPSTSSTPPSSLPRTSTASPAGPLVSGFWDDLGCAQTNGMPFDFQYQTLTLSGTQVMVLQWNNYRRCSNDGGTTFQIQLWANGDVAVVFDLVTAQAGSAAWDVYNGSGAWIGLEGPDRTKPVSALFRRVGTLEGRSFLFKKK